MINLDLVNINYGKELYHNTLPDAATSVYRAVANKSTEILEFVVCNTSNASRWFSIWIDTDGSTYDNTTKLFHEVSISGNTTLVIPVKQWMNHPLGNIAAQAQNNSDITLTISGIEHDVS
jgi:hypothetical protein